MNIKRLMDIGTYRGTRHRKNLPVRGQRTHTNARTKKGRGARSRAREAPPEKVKCTSQGGGREARQEGGRGRRHRHITATSTTRSSRSGHAGERPPWGSSARRVSRARRSRLRSPPRWRPSRRLARRETWASGACTCACRPAPGANPRSRPSPRRGCRFRSIRRRDADPATMGCRPPRSGGSRSWHVTRACLQVCRSRGDEAVPQRTRCLTESARWSGAPTRRAAWSVVGGGGARRRTISASCARNKRSSGSTGSRSGSSGHFRSRAQGARRDR